MIIQGKFKILTFGILLFIFTSVLAFIAILYKSEITYSGIYREYYNYFLGALIVQIIFGIFLLLVNNEKKKNFILFFFSLFFSIFIIEISLNYILKRNISSENYLNQIRLDYFANKGQKVDRRNIYQLYLDLLEENKIVVPSVQPQNFENFYTFGGVSETLTISCNESGYYPLYISDNFGFNNPNNLKMGNIEIALVGDSFTWGACVDREKTIAGQIRSKSNFKIINYGVPDSGPLIQLGILNEYVKFDQPKTVFYLYYEGNDLSNLRKEKKNDKLVKYLEKNFSQNLRLKQKEIDKKLLQEIQKRIMDKEKKNYVEKNISKADLIKNNIKFKNIRNLLGIDNFDSFKPIDPFYEKILIKFKEDVKSWGGNLYFVYLPSAKHYNLFYNNRKLKYKEIISLVKKLDIPIIDMHKEIFLKTNKPMELFPGEVYGHYNEQGYSLVAEELLKKIINE